MDETPLVSIIIPVKPGGGVTALDALHRVDYPYASFEVLLTEGRKPARQRNRAAALAAGDILYFLDDDSLVSPGFIRKAANHFTAVDVAAVGGPSITPASDSLLQRSFGLVLGSRFGGGGMRNRYRKTGGSRKTCDRELILCNLGFRKDRFMELGGFDERLYPNEENELLERIKRSGGVLVHDPDLAVLRSQRPTLKAFTRQLFGYGRGRGQQTVLSGVVKPVTFIPSLFVIYLLSLPFAHKAVYYVPLLCYLIMTLLAAGREMVREGRPGASLLLPAVFPIFHICYGLGMFRGLFSKASGKASAEDAQVTIRRLKEFDGDWEQAL
ncbi:MAG TPA: glycosyltransferase [Geobacteraceae bacterium]|nr:glycosyltransferase [Geobacteraceae bacterium]